MINQKPISARINFERVKDLEQEAFVTGKSKNDIINRAIQVYCHFADARRRAIISGATDDWNDICVLLGLRRYQV